MKANRVETKVSAARWAKYAAAGAAGAVAVLGPQATVDADLTVVDLNTTLEDRSQGDGYFDIFGPYGFGAAGASFQMQQAFNETASGSGQLLIIGSGNMQIAGNAVGAYRYVGNLAYGACLSSQSFAIAAGERGDMAWGGGYGASNFLNAGTSYVGFQFDVGAGTQYGWAEYVMDGAPLNTATFVRYAWGDVGDVVKVGELAQVPEPGSLGLLALGSIGVTLWRRRRSA